MRVIPGRKIATSQRNLREIFKNFRTFDAKSWKLSGVSVDWDTVCSASCSFKCASGGNPRPGPRRSRRRRGGRLLKLKEVENFGGLVLLCIEADFYVQIRILQHFSRSTRFKNLCTAPNSKIRKILTIFFNNFQNFDRFRRL